MSVPDLGDGLLGHVGGLTHRLVGMAHRDQVHPVAEVAQCGHCLVVAVQQVEGGQAAALHPLDAGPRLGDRGLGRLGEVVRTGRGQGRGVRRGSGVCEHLRSSRSGLPRPYRVAPTFLADKSRLGKSVRFRPMTLGQLKTSLDNS